MTKRKGTEAWAIKDPKKGLFPVTFYTKSDAKKWCMIEYKQKAVKVLITEIKDKNNDHQR